MKRIIKTLFILLYLTISTSCTTDDDISHIDKEEFETLSTYQFTGTQKFMDLPHGVSGTQGSANFREYFFQGYNGNSAIDVYNLRTKAFVCRIPISKPASNSRYHANTLNFGNQYIAQSDQFPVLYVCSGYTESSSTKSFVFAYRIIPTEDKFEAELVQTITLDFGSWTEAVSDNEHDAIWIKDQVDGYTYRKYNVPRIADGDCTISIETEALAEIKLGNQPFTSHNQGHLFYDDRIFLASGVPSWNEKIALVIINTITGKRESIIDLFDLGLYNTSAPQSNSFEPEGVIVYDNQIMICYRNAIYKLTNDEN